MIGWLWFLIGNENAAHTLYTGGGIFSGPRLIKSLGEGGLAGEYPNPIPLGDKLVHYDPVGNGVESGALFLRHFIRGAHHAGRERQMANLKKRGFQIAECG
jgi:hypothetical protein